MLLDSTFDAFVEHLALIDLGSRRTEMSVRLLPLSLESSELFATHQDHVVGIPVMLFVAKSADIVILYLTDGIGKSRPHLIRRELEADLRQGARKGGQWY